MKQQLVLLLLLFACSACLGDIKQSTAPLSDSGVSDEPRPEPSESVEDGLTEELDANTSADAASNSRGDTENDSNIGSDTDWDAGTQTDAEIDAGDDPRNDKDVNSGIEPGADLEKPCNPDNEPTWNDSIDPIMSTRCARCHWEASSYQTVQVWVDNGKLAAYTNKTHFWGEPKNAQTTSRWLDIGAPKTDCDIR